MPSALGNVCGYAWPSHRALAYDFVSWDDEIPYAKMKHGNQTTNKINGLAMILYSVPGFPIWLLYVGVISQSELEAIPHHISACPSHLAIGSTVFVG